MLRRPRDVDFDDDATFNFDVQMEGEELATATNTRIDPPAPSLDPMEIDDEDDEADEIVPPAAADQPAEPYLKRKRRKRQERAWSRQITVEQITKARTIESNLDNWIADYFNNPGECWRLIEHELKHQISAPIPTDKDENFAHMHEIIRLIELVSIHANEMPSGVMKQIHRLGTCLWTYYAQTLHARGAPKVDMIEWWCLLCNLHYIITTNMPAHVLFSGDWYQQTSIHNLLLMNAEASTYLSWAHGNGWATCEPPPRQEPRNTDGVEWDYLSAAGELSSSTELISPDSRSPTPRLEPKNIETLVITEYRDKPVAALPIDRTWRLLSVIHHNFNRIRWTPATELLMLLLWHHVQGFTLGRLPRHLFNPAGDYLWEEQDGFLVAKELFVDRTGHILIRHLACIHAFYSLRSQVDGTWQDATQFTNAIPMGIYDQLALAKPEFLPTINEQTLLEECIEKAHASNSYQILPGQTTIDKHAVKKRYMDKLPPTILVPGDTLMLAKTTMSLKLHPRTVLAKFRAKQDGILADLVIPYTAASMIFKANRPGGAWPRGQEDLELLGAQAHTALFYAVLRALEAGRPDHATAKAANRIKERERKLQDMLVDPQVSLKQALRNNERRLYQQAAVIAEGTTTTTTNQSSSVEFQPPLERWWILCEDAQFDMPFLYPRMIRSTNKDERQLPTLFSARGEHWIFDTEHRLFVGRTTHTTDALRLYSCLTAFLYPDHYETHLEPLLVYWYKDSLQAYARAGRACRKHQQQQQQ